MNPATVSMSTLPAHLIVERLSDCTVDQLRAAVVAALRGLDNVAVDEVYSATYVDGTAVSTLNAVAAAVGLPSIEPDDLDDEGDFFV